MIRLLPATAPSEIQEARRLIREYGDYQESLGIDLAFQGFEEELAALPGRYAPPDGALLLAFTDAAPLGCVALRPIEHGACEMKRLYVRPEARGRGVGRRLAVAIIEEARRLGYRTMRLDTIDTMVEALGLYRSLGFEEISPYYANPNAGVVYLEFAL
jgi:putative acetyltransferase